MERLTLLGASLFLLFSLLSCGKEAEPIPTSAARSATGSAGGGSESAGALRVTRLGAAVETEELSLLILREAPESLNPWRDPSDLELLLFPRAIRRDPETLDWEPWMAESWKFSEDRRSVEVTIRGGASWSDGVPVTAADWVSVANRYFGDNALRTPYRGRPELFGLDPQWELLGELRFSITVRHPVGRNTLLHLLYLPPLPERFWEARAGGPGLSQRINELWRLSRVEPPGGASGPWAGDGETPPSAGPYEFLSLQRDSAGAVTAVLRRRSAYRDASYGAPAAKTVEMSYGTDLSAVGEREPDLIYIGENQSPEATPSGYRYLSAGTDMTPTILFFAPSLSQRAEILSIAAEAKRAFFGDTRRPGVVRRDFPSVGETSTLFGNLESEEAPGLAAGPIAGARELRFLAFDRPLHRQYAELFVQAAGGAGLSVRLEYLSQEEIARALLAGESWDLLLLEARESFEPLIGDPLLGSAIPLTGQWNILASAAPQRSVVTEPLSPTELSALRGGVTDPAELPAILPRLWRNVAASSREADRQRATGVLRELWATEQPWLYLFDQDRRHYARPNLGNLIFRHLPGAELGTVLPRMYHEAGGPR